MRLPLNKMSLGAKYPISALPLPPLPTLLTKCLTPDPNTSSITAFREVLRKTPSIQRRARLLSPESHFSHISPCPLPFPYDIQPPEDQDSEEADKSSVIESWLAAREPAIPQPTLAQYPDGPLRKYLPENRDQPLELIGISETGLRDCAPHLDVGDAFQVIGAPSLSDEFSDEGDGTPSDREDIRAARQDLVQVLSGHAMLMSEDFAPWSVRYSGHQFGNWAGQLGDGRAISVRELNSYYLVCVLRSGQSSRDTQPSNRRELGIPTQGRGPHAIFSECRWACCLTIFYQRIFVLRRSASAS
jgi:hypothetical protein